MLTVVVPLLTNKDVFEPSYDDVNFTVQKHNYFCASLTKASRASGLRRVQATCSQSYITRLVLSWYTTYTEKANTKQALHGLPQPHGGTSSPQ